MWKERRRCSFLLINLVSLTPVVVEGCYYGYTWASKRESPLLLFLPDDDHTGDDTNHSGGVTEISECVISKWSGQELSFHSTVLVLYFLPLLLFVYSFFLWGLSAKLSFPPSSLPVSHIITPVSSSRHSLINGWCLHFEHKLHSLVCCSIKYRSYILFTLLIIWCYAQFCSNGIMYKKMISVTNEGYTIITDIWWFSSFSNLIWPDLLYLQRARVTKFVWGQVWKHEKGRERVGLWDKGSHRWTILVSLYGLCSLGSLGNLSAGCQSPR